ncbi:hypothetical protein R3I94_009234 [Phoxinus phoxinus]
MRVSLNPGCVWSVRSPEAEIWDVWTDIHCNDGLLLTVLENQIATVTLSWLDGNPHSVKLVRLQQQMCLSNKWIAEGVCITVPMFNT